LVDCAIIMEGTGVLDALGRSRDLVQGRWFKTFGLILVLFILSALLGLVLLIATSSFGSLTSAVITSVFAALINPIGAISKTYLYYSMKTKAIITEQGLPPPPPPTGSV
jgi:hypothetical protein